jgi:RNA polymerase sigma-70 factor (ECF subfamily)
MTAATAALAPSAALPGNAAAPTGVVQAVPVTGRDDAELIALAQRGDVHAYEQLVERHADVAFRVACVVCGNAADAEEAAQDAFVKAYAALGRFRTGAPWRPWLLRIAANEARNRRRAAGRRTRAELRVSRDTLVSPSSEAAVLVAERDGELRAALARLDDRDREVLYLRYFLDLAEAEIAAALDCRPGTVKSRLSRALGRLRAQLGEEAASA